MKFTADSSFRIEFVHTGNTSSGCSRDITPSLNYSIQNISFILDILNLTTCLRALIGHQAKFYGNYIRISKHFPTHSKPCHCNRKPFGGSLKFVKLSNLRRMKFTADSSCRVEFIHAGNTSGGCSRDTTSSLNYYTQKISFIVDI